jgi:hypothetical protein
MMFITVMPILSIPVSCRSTTAALNHTCPMTIRSCITVHDLPEHAITFLADFATTSASFVYVTVTLSKLPSFAFSRVSVRLSTFLSARACFLSQSFFLLRGPAPATPQGLRPRLTTLEISTSSSPNIYLNTPPDSPLLSFKS